LKNKGKICYNNGDNKANYLLSATPEVADIEEKAAVGLVPQKSRQQYELVYVVVCV
jgi:hypothetical protein